MAYMWVFMRVRRALWRVYMGFYESVKGSVAYIWVCMRVLRALLRKYGFF